MNHDDIPAIVEMRRNLPEWLTSEMTRRSLDIALLTGWSTTPIITSTRGRKQAERSEVRLQFGPKREYLWIRRWDSK